MVSAADDTVLRAEAERELATRNPIDFARRVFPGFQAPLFIRRFGELSQEVVSGRLRRLAVGVSVRHSKSVSFSQILPAFYLGKHPTKNVILAGHSEELSVRNARVARNIVADRTRWPFPSVELAQDSQSDGRWNTTQGGGVYAVGVGGSITGRGADLLIIDDPLHDGLSASEREKAWAWYCEVAVPRLEPGGSILIVHARLAEDDLIGRVLESEDGAAWKYVCLPAIAQEDDPLGRTPGEALWPERMDIPELEMRRQIMGSIAFESQFLQRPLPRGGSMIHVDWLQQRFDELPDDSPKRDVFGMLTRPRRNLVIQAIDTAQKTGLHNDWSVIATLATDWVSFYICDIWRKRVEFHELMTAVRENYLIHQPRAVYIEDAASGTPLVQELKRNSAFPVIAIRAEGSKESRIAAQSPLFEAGKVKLKRNASFLDQFISEASAYPAGRFDDAIDAVALGLSKLRSAVIAEAQSRDLQRRIGGQSWRAR
jgi:predicted phage terminase large subunit-like protein